MCHQALSDKGWLRQYMPHATPDQLHNFIERVSMMLEAHPRPTPEQTERARQYTYRALNGALAP